MSWIKLIAPKHTCKLPPISDADVGSEWECEECGDVWIVIRVGIASRTWVKKS